MISIEQINGEIAVLEEEKPTHVIMQKLAALYTVRDHIVIDSPTPTAIISETVPEFMIDSDFVNSIQGQDIRSVIPKVNELVEAVQVTNPRLYDNFMRNINGQI